MMSSSTGNGLKTPTPTTPPGAPIPAPKPALYQKPIPPPTVPKTYTPSAASAYRLASLERLSAHRQKTLENHMGPNGNGASTPSPSSAEPPLLQSKRDLFFKNELPGNSVAPPQPPISNMHAGNTSTPKTEHKNGDLVNGNGLATLPTGGVVVPPNGHVKEGKIRHENEVLDGIMKKPIKGERDKPPAPPAPKIKELDGFVGFANFPNQIYRKAIKRGFEFNLMVVGQSGLGKSTLINSLFLTDIYNADYPGPTLRAKKTVKVETTRCLMKENKVDLYLTIVDTPGFGDAIDNTDCWVPVVNYIESRFEDYFNAESRCKRTFPIPDNRVHCCLYFIQPTGHGLKALDVEVMLHLHDKVNIIPVIAKADTMLHEELIAFKSRVLQEIKDNKINIYEFPDKDSDDGLKIDHKSMKERVPFAIVASDTMIEGPNGKKIRGRKYPWGLVDVENLDHCDFLVLRDMIVRMHLQDLRDVTTNMLYENYRSKKMASVTCDPDKGGRILNKNPLAQMEEEEKEHEFKLQKMQAEMEQVFCAKVKEKEQKAKAMEEELKKRHEHANRKLEVALKDLEDRRLKFENEKRMWEQTMGVTLEELRRRSHERLDTLDGKEKKKKRGIF